MKKKKDKVTIYCGGEVTTYTDERIIKEFLKRPSRSKLTARQDEYRKYLRSQDWTDRSRDLKAHYGYTCMACGNKNKLALHHLNYDCLGNEQPKDVVLVCSGCHLKIHKKMLSVVSMTNEEYSTFQKVEHLFVDVNYLLHLV